MFLCRPEQFEDLQKVAAAMRNQQAVLVILDKADPPMKLRMLDFLSGAACGMEQTLERVSGDVCLLSPPGALASGDEEPAEPGESENPDSAL